MHNAWKVKIYQPKKKKKNEISIFILYKAYPWFYLCSETNKAIGNVIRLYPIKNQIKKKKKKNQGPKGPNWVPTEHVMQILMSVTKKIVQVESNEKKN